MDNDPYRNSSEMRMKSRLDRKLSATARIPKRSTIVESPTGRTAQPDNMMPSQRNQDQQKPTIHTPANVTAAQQGSVRQSQTRSPPHMYQQPGASDSKNTLTQESAQQVLRPDFTRYNTGVRIRDDASPASPVSELTPGPPQDDTITLADLANLMDAPKRSTTPYIAELSPLELTLVKHAALAMLSRGPLREQVEMDQLLEMLEIKKSGFWNKLFKADKKTAKKKGQGFAAAAILLERILTYQSGVFGVPLELLVEREGSDCVLGVTRATLRVPSFIDDIVSAMRQMGSSFPYLSRQPPF